MYRRVCILLAASALLAGALDADAQDRIELRRGGQASVRASAGWIGISFRATSDRESPIVEAVDPGAPADRAGIREGDRIVSWNGRSDVVAAINASDLAPGETVQVRIRREGESDRDVSIVAAERPGVRIVRLGRGGRPDVMIDRRMLLRGDSLRVHADSLQSRLRLMLRDSLGTRMGSPAELRSMLENLRASRFSIRPLEPGSGVGAALAIGRSGVAGAEFADVTPGLATYFGTEKGALVLRVAPNTPAARAGLAEGDVIVRAAERDVESVIDLRRAIAGSADDINLEIIRRNERFSLTIER